jgi:hypothetical protein
MSERVGQSPKMPGNARFENSFLVEGGQNGVEKGLVWGRFLSALSTARGRKSWPGQAFAIASHL